MAQHAFECNNSAIADVKVGNYRLAMPNNMYFLGVTTAQSSIHKIFPRWTALAGVGDAALRGIDLAVDAPPAKYRAAVRTILDDPDAAGGLVTTHKVSVFTH